MCCKLENNEAQSRFHNTAISVGFLFCLVLENRRIDDYGIYLQYTRPLIDHQPYLTIKYSKTVPTTIFALKFSCLLSIFTGIMELQWALLWHSSRFFPLHWTDFSISINFLFLITHCWYWNRIISNNKKKIHLLKQQMVKISKSLRFNTTQTFCLAYLTLILNLLASFVIDTVTCQTRNCPIIVVATKNVANLFDKVFFFLCSSKRSRLWVDHSATTVGLCRFYHSRYLAMRIII